MKNVKRTDEPSSFRDHSGNWTRKLLDKITACSQAGETVPACYYNKYNGPDVKQALEKMYDGLCCYCESAIGIVDYPHIEHRMPKKRFPDCTYRWSNLHLACQKCNMAKGEKFDTNHPILDAVEDVPIAGHMGYDIRETGVWRNGITHRGNTTIEHTKLNRERLMTTRIKLLLRVLGLVAQVNDNPGTPAVNTVVSELKEMTKREYGSLVEFAINKYIRLM